MGFCLISVKPGVVWRKYPWCVFTACVHVWISKPTHTHKKNNAWDVEMLFWYLFYFASLSVFALLCAVCEVKMTDIKMLIHQDMLRRKKFGQVCSKAIKYWAALCCLFCLLPCYQYSTAELEMFLVLWNPITIEMVRKRALSSPGEREPWKRSKGHWVYVLYTRPLL